MTDPTVAENFYLEEGDYIIVKAAYHTVLAEEGVQRPYDTYELTEGEGLKELFSYAGGLKPSASKSRVNVSRYGKDNRIIIDVDYERLERSGGNYKLLPGDIVTIKEISDDFENRVYVNGAVYFVGDYALARNTRVSDVVSKAAPLPTAKLDTAYIIRLSPDQITKVYIPVNLKNILNSPRTAEDLVLQNRDSIFILDKTTILEESIIRVTGAVNKQYKAAYAKDLTIKTLIDLAGGVSRDATNIAYIIRTRKDNTRAYIRIELDKFLNSSDTDTNRIVIEPNDELRVYSLLQIARYYNVTIEGPVKKPDSYIYDSTFTVRDLVYLAEGLEDGAYHIAYLIRQRTDGTSEYLRVNLNKVLAEDATEEDLIRLKPRDKLRIIESSTIVDAYDVMVGGAVREPKTIPYDPSLKLSDLIMLAGGLKLEASRGRVEISRVIITDGKPTEIIVATTEVDDFGNPVSGNDFELKPFDQVFVRTSPKFELQRNIEITGEVMYPGNYTLLGNNEKLESIIKRAGGFTDEAFLKGAVLTRKSAGLGKVIVDLENVENNPKSRFNFILKEGDELFIPKQNNLVTITGAVDYPQIDTVNQVSVPYHRSKRAKFYVNRYVGGIDKNKRGRSNLISVKYANGQVKRTVNWGFFKVYPKVSKGSTITVGVKPLKPVGEEDKEAIDWEGIAARVLSQVTAIVTLIVLVQNL